MEPKKAKIPRKKAWIDCGDYLIRTLTTDDASDRWGAWMSDPEVVHMLNVKPRSMTKSDVANYIKTFDQRSNLLLGIFEKQTKTLIGFFAIHADYALSQGTVSLLIGDPQYRHHGVLSVVRRQFAEYFFETMGIKTMMATALARNEIILNTLLKAGWAVDKTLKQHVQAHTDGAKLDLCLLSLSRDVWRARRKGTATGA
jgi:RimJ/RimL family protein N-acetyltransferase